MIIDKAEETVGETNQIGTTEQCQKLIENVQRVIICKPTVVKDAACALLAGGHILLEGTPEWLDVDDMQSKIVNSNPEVKEIHHVHVWGLTPQHPMLTMHVALKQIQPDTTSIVRSIKNLIKEEYGINHSTIEVECDDCADD